MFRKPSIRAIILRPDDYYRIKKWEEDKTYKLFCWEENLIKPKMLSLIFDLMHGRIPIFIDAGRIIYKKVEK